VVRAANYYLEHVGELPEARHMVLRYEDLCASPNEVMEPVLRFLDAKPEADVDFSAYISPRNQKRLPVVEENLPTVAPGLSAYCKEFGYTLLEE
jgi:hypothetical protein